MLSNVRIDPVTDSLKQFCERESIGIVDKGDAHISLDEEESVKQFNEGLKFDGECYEVPLLWKSDAPPLKSNYLQAVKIGDIALISEGKVSRGKWPMGRGDRLLPGKDGLIRTVILKGEERASKETCSEATSFGSKQYSVCKW